MTILSAMYYGNYIQNQCGKVIVFALIVSLIIAWQTLYILETGWREQKLLQQQLVAVQARQAVLSISTAITRWLQVRERRQNVLVRLQAGDQIQLCFDAQGRLVATCEQQYLGLLRVESTLTSATAIEDISGDGWRYIMVRSRAQTNIVRYAELLLLAVEEDSGEMRVQQRHWETY